MSVCNCHGMIFLDCPNYYRNKEKAKPQMSTASESELVGQPICPICGSMMSDEMGWRQTDGGRIVVKVHCKNPEHVQDGSAFHSFLLDFPPVDVNAQVAAAVEECADAASQDAQAILTSIGNIEHVIRYDWNTAPRVLKDLDEDFDRIEKCTTRLPERMRSLSTESATQALERIILRARVEEADKRKHVGYFDAHHDAASCELCLEHVSNIERIVKLETQAKAHADQR